MGFELPSGDWGLSTGTPVTNFALGSKLPIGLALNSHPLGIDSYQSGFDDGSTSVEVSQGLPRITEALILLTARSAAGGWKAHRGPPCRCSAGWATAGETWRVLVVRICEKHRSPSCSRWSLRFHGMVVRDVPLQHQPAPAVGDVRGERVGMVGTVLQRSSSHDHSRYNPGGARR